MIRTRLAILFLTLPCLFSLRAAEPVPGTPPTGPLSPKEELATFRVPKGFRVELVASEPQVVDPVAMAFDEDGRLFVAEMRGYPNGGIAEGPITSGKIKLLEDKDGDGVYETATVYADGLRFPTAVMPWKGGLLVANAPDILFLEDSDGDGKADRTRRLYTGFGLSNIQQLINGLQWGMDNWVYGVAGNNGGTITAPEAPKMPAVPLNGRGVRFHPETPGSLEPTSGGGQYGLAPDQWQNWFTATNSQHLRHIVLPDHYLRRNPSLPVSAVTLDIPDHGAACKVHRISPFEAWRVERTERRAKGPDAQRFPATELVPGGFITSACSPVVSAADLFPAAYRGNTFVCDPANNLVHRDVLEPNGATFTAKRGEADCEFLASTDTWFRPVCLTLGPDGAIYVLDFYREAIETPLSLPDDIKKKLNLESRGRGRIWRIVPDSVGRDAKGSAKRKPSLSKASAEELVAHLADANLWWRLTAQRLLVERQDKAAVAPLAKLARDADFAPGRAHALWALRGLGALDDAAIEHALKDRDAGVREQALRLADDRLAKSESLCKAVAVLADDPSPRVRFQLAFTLGQADAPEVVAALAKVARQDVADPWTQTAVLSSAGRTAPALLEAFARDKEITAAPSAAHLQFLTRLAALVAARNTDADLARVLALLGEPTEGAAGAWQVALLNGLGQGLQNTSRPLSRLWDAPPPSLKDAVEKALPFFKRAAATARDAKAPAADRAGAARLLGVGPYSLAAPALQECLAPQNPAELQLAAVRALSAHDSAKVPEVLLSGWGGYSPTVRREVLEALFSRPARLSALLDAIEAKKVLGGQIEPVRLEQFRKHPDAKLRQRAQKLLAGQTSADRRKVVEDYGPALELKGDAARGKAAFKKSCGTCHRLENEGIEVGPDLLSALRNKSKDQLLSDILDPSREVDPRYINYLVTTKAGRTFSGMIAAETASSLTLRRAEKAEDTILRNQIEEIQATPKSVMPEGLEMQLTKQDVADVIAYLQAVAAGK
ncbi:MAG TPA: PVC-type heme-binding CxxCH protein [Gemmataceae bacterium]|nr:PVC-type heme-binding CxxCH protein [Gemmataceae bacterium]